MQKNPHLQVLVVNGLYDLATPFFATEYTFDHLGVRGDLLQNVKHAYYPAGHMMYTDKTCLKSLTKELHQFVKKSS
jgi:carboxypeptidase C (cathepsin A)